MDNIWKNAARKVRAKQNQATTATAAITTTTSTPAPGNVSATPTPAPFYDAETMTLEQLAETRHRLVRDWPPGDGIPFPEAILEVLDELKVKIMARDATRQEHIEAATYTVQVASTASTVTAA